MKKVISLSGGRTSGYIAANYKADNLVFALVRTDDKKCLFPDKKLRQVVEDRIEKPFIGTLEMNEIIYTILDIEQMIGQEVSWVSGETFDEVVDYRGGWLPNKLHRYCTTNMKLFPIFHWWHKTFDSPVEMMIGYRANELRRAKKMMERVNDNGLLEIKQTVKKRPDGRNHWEMFEWQKPLFPLIDDNIRLDDIHNFWVGKNVRFAPFNNCVGCFHRNPIFLKKMWDERPIKMQWFADQEEKEGKDQWRKDMKYADIKKHKSQIEISFDDFSDCDSGYCGL